MPAEYSVTFIDYSGEKSTSTFQLQTGYTTLEVGALYDALNDVSLGNPAQTVISDIARISNANAGSESAQREMKLLIRYEDTTTFKVYTVTVPCIDLNNLTITPNTDLIDLTVGNAPALVTAFEAVVASPAGNATNVLEMMFVGRNS